MYVLVHIQCNPLFYCQRLQLFRADTTGRLFERFSEKGPRDVIRDNSKRQPAESWCQRDKTTERNDVVGGVWRWPAGTAITTNWYMWRGYHFMCMLVNCCRSQRTEDIRTCAVQPCHIQLYMNTDWWLRTKFILHEFVTPYSRDSSSPADCSSCFSAFVWLHSQVPFHTHWICKHGDVMHHIAEPPSTLHMRYVFLRSVCGSWWRTVQRVGKRMPYAMY